MHKMLTALLLGATIATPALAQDRGPDDDRLPRSEDRRDDGRADDGRFGRTRDDDRQRGPNRGVQAGVAVPGVGVQADLRGGDDQRYRDADRGDRPVLRDGRQDDRYGGRGSVDARGPRGDGRFDDRGRDGRRGDWNGNGRNDRFADNRGDSRWQGGSGTWNRDWRGDRRYDWQSYRRGNDRAFRAPRYYGPRGYDSGYRRWSAGYRIQPAYYGQNYWIARPDLYRLPPAYGGYRWVRYYDDVALIDLRSGVIADILYGFFL